MPHNNYSTLRDVVTYMYFICYFSGHTVSHYRTPSRSDSWWYCRRTGDQLTHSGNPATSYVFEPLYPDAETYGPPIPADYPDLDKHSIKISYMPWPVKALYGIWLHGSLVNQLLYQAPQLVRVSATRMHLEINISLTNFLSVLLVYHLIALAMSDMKRIKCYLWGQIIGLPWIVPYKTKVAFFI